MKYFLDDGSGELKQLLFVKVDRDGDTVLEFPEDGVTYISGKDWLDAVMEEMSASGCHHLDAVEIVVDHYQQEYGVGQYRREPLSSREVGELLEYLNELIEDGDPTYDGHEPYTIHSLTQEMRL